MRALFSLPAVVVALLAAPALALEWNPPARYDHPYEGRLIIRYAPQAEMPGLCRALFAEAGLADTSHPDQRGCAVHNGNGECSVILIDRPYKGAEPGSVLRHEIGHCNGWPADHPE